MPPIGFLGGELRTDSGITEQPSRAGDWAQQGTTHLTALARPTSNRLTGSRRRFLSVRRANGGAREPSGALGRPITGSSPTLTGRSWLAPRPRHRDAPTQKKHQGAFTRDRPLRRAIAWKWRRVEAPFLQVSMSSPTAKPLPVIPNCLDCGSCCFQRRGTILVTDEDVARWQSQGRNDILTELEPGHFGMLAFKMNERGSCVFHGTDAHPHACAIYEDRATVCREFEAGCEQCHEFRRDIGLEPKLNGQGRPR